MAILRDFSKFVGVRLNSILFPVTEYEAELYKKYCFQIMETEVSAPEDIISCVANCDAIFVVSAELPASIIDSLSRCRVISRLGVGTDKINVRTATEKGILVTNVPDFCVEEQADHTLALILSLVRKLPQMSRFMFKGAWRQGRLVSNTSHRIPGQILGLVGFGRSAQAVARRAHGFGMKILATRRNMNASSQVAGELGVEMVSLNTLLSTADIVSLHLPLNDKTYHLLNSKTLGRMKPTAILINTSRGAIVEEEALVKLLYDGKLAGAGLDTFENINVHAPEEKAPDHPLLALENVVLTPHVAALSVEARQNVAVGGIQNTMAVLSGHWPPQQNVINPRVIPRAPLKYLQENF